MNKSGILFRRGMFCGQQAQARGQSEIGLRAEGKAQKTPTRDARPRAGSVPASASGFVAALDLFGSSSPPLSSWS